MSTVPVLLPTYTTSLVGRNHETRAIAHLLQEQQTRLVSLVGNSGTGKTRLSLEVANSVLDTFPDGVYFVPLAAINDPLLVLATIAQTLEVKEQGTESLITTLITTLQHQRILLILDNVEQVRAAASEIEQLIDGTTQLYILITSQIPLDIPSEHVFLIPPLDMPPFDESHSVESLLHFPAIALFIDRLRNTQPEFTLTLENARSVHEICTRVAGLPLAIELVAAHSWGLTPQVILDLLSSHLVLHPPHSIAQLSRKDILDPLLDWCYAMLEPDLRTLFMRLGVFAGGWTLDALDPICNPDQALSLNIQESIATLVKKHLVIEETLSGQTQRYVMLDAIHLYVEEKLKDSPDYLTTVINHTDFYKVLALASSKALRGEDQAQWLTRLTGEHPNLRIALSRSLANEQYNNAAQISGSLARFWFLRGHLQEGRRWLNLVLKTNPDNITLTNRALVLHGAGMLAYTQGNYTEAETLYQECVDIYTSIDNRHQAALITNNLGLVAWQKGKLDRAQQLFEQSIIALRPFDDMAGIANALSNLGVIASEQGNLDRAEAYYMQCLDIRRKQNEPQAVAILLQNLAITMFAKGNMVQAERLLRESLAISRDLELITLIANTNAVLGYVLLRQEHMEESFSLLYASLQLRTKLGQIDGILDTLAKLAAWSVQRNPLWALRTLSMVHHLYQSYDINVDPFAQQWDNQTIVALRQIVSASDWKQVWNDSKNDDLHAVVKRVLDQTDFK